MKAKIEGIGAAIDAINAKKIVIPFESEAAARIDEIKEKLDSLTKSNAALTVNTAELEVAKTKAEELLQKLNELIQIGKISIDIEAPNL
ncbi:MAG: hypothetical protein BWX54_02047 [Verrucomicrobia bacterium ADurb.Bin018]|nr:MAG: hypothetical protein BWX54_02047 [Verrucomicrobia bacterium ADurb.Bin018]